MIMMRKNELLLLRDIVRVCQRGENIKKTHIMYQVNLSYDQLDRYIKMAKNSGFIEAVSDNDNTWKARKECIIYVATPRGIEYADKLDSASLMVNYNE